MQPGVWQYNDVEKQTAYFRGYVKEYQGQKVIKHACKEVRTSRLKAKEDAKELAKQLRK